jgi:hypothetical protein
VPCYHAVAAIGYRDQEERRDRANRGLPRGTSPGWSHLIPRWATYEAWRSTYRELMPQVTLGGVNAPTDLKPLEVNPRELAEQAAKALELAGIDRGENRGNPPIISPWTNDPSPPGPLIREVNAEVPPGECLAPPRVSPRGRPKKARFRRPHEEAQVGISEEDLALGQFTPRRPPRGQVCTVCGDRGHNRRRCTQRQE